MNGRGLHREQWRGLAVTAACVGLVCALPLVFALFDEQVAGKLGAAAAAALALGALAGLLVALWALRGLSRAGGPATGGRPRTALALALAAVALAVAWLPGRMLGSWVIERVLPGMPAPLHSPWLHLLLAGVLAVAAGMPESRRVWQPVLRRGVDMPGPLSLGFAAGYLSRLFYP